MIVGRGTRDRAERRSSRPASADALDERLDARGGRAALDAATVPRAARRARRGFGRVVVEAFCRGRAVVGSRVGGIPDLVEDGANGLLVDPGRREALADALVRVLSDRALAERLGAARATRRAAAGRRRRRSSRRAWRELVDQAAH